MSIRFTVTNIGPDPAVDIAVSTSLTAPDTINIDHASWGELNDGVTIEPGAAYQTTFVGRMANPAVTTAMLAGLLYDETGFDVREFSFSVPGDADLRARGRRHLRRRERQRSLRPG